MIVLTGVDDGDAMRWQFRSMMKTLGGLLHKGLQQRVQSVAGEAASWRHNRSCRLIVPCGMVGVEARQHTMGGLGGKHSKQT